MIIPEEFSSGCSLKLLRQAKVPTNLDLHIIRITYEHQKHHEHHERRHHIISVYQCLRSLNKSM